MDKNCILDEYGYGWFEPDEAYAGSEGIFEFNFITGTNGLDEGDILILSPYQRVAHTWDNPQVLYPCEANYVTADVDDASVKFGMKVNGKTISIVIREGKLKAGSIIRIVFGDRRQGSPGWRMMNIENKIPFRIYIQSHLSNEKIEIPASPAYFQVKPSALSVLEVTAPSTVKHDECFELQVRGADEFGNSADIQEEASIEVLPVVGLNQTGEVKQKSDNKAILKIPYKISSEFYEKTIKIKVRSKQEKLEAVCNPVKIVEEGADKIFWGDIHCHSNLAQALETPEFLYEWAINEANLDFLCHVEHDAAKEKGWIGEEWRRYTPKPSDLGDYINKIWEKRKSLVKQHYKPGKFVTLLGYEWASNIHGHMNVIYSEDNADIFYPTDFHRPEEIPEDVWQKLNPGKAITIPHHVSYPVNRARNPGHWEVGGWNWDHYNPEYLRLVEIYSKHGSSEYFGGPMSNINQAPEGCVSEALRRGCRVGFTGSSDSHSSRAGSRIHVDLHYPSGGITAVFAKNLDRESIHEALYKRHCYATTGARILLDFQVNRAVMGEEIRIEDPLQEKRIEIMVGGTNNIDRVEIIKNNNVFNRFLGQALGRGRDRMQIFTIDNNPTQNGDFYYVRVIQTDGAMAWSSPIWIDTAK